MIFNYYALHYHMKSGGVKIVIENLMRAFSRHSRNHFALIESGKQLDYKAPLKIRHIKIPELNYDDRIFSSQAALENKAKSLMQKIESKMDFSRKCVLHAHNVNLFKNSYLATALRMLAEKHKDLLLLLQVHDFAEERKDRLKLMLNCTGKKDQKLAGKLAYPLTRNTLYLTINSRDKRLLKHIGIPQQKIFVFPNAVNTSFFMQKPLKDDRLLELIEEYARKNNYLYSKQRKILLYPVKVMRRKNVVEALLILKMLNSIRDEYQLLITLDASSKDDVAYSDALKDYVRKHRLPVVIGFGFEVISADDKQKKDGSGNIVEYTLPDLFFHAECILTTSLLEGFGFAFVEGWLANKQVVGRRIDFVMEDFERQGIEFPGFYDRILVKGKDFASYDYHEQLKLLDSVNLSSVKKQVPKLIKTIERPSAEVITRNRSIIARQYSLKSYLEKLESIILKAGDLHYFPAEVNDKYLIDYFSAKKAQPVIITDMDGSFLDEQYSFMNALPAYRQAISMKIPVCFCTSKSYPEMPYFISKLGMKPPMILENGSAIYVPEDYFSFDIHRHGWQRDYGIRKITEHEGYDIIELNVPHDETYAVLKRMQKELSFPINIYTEHSDEELVRLTNLKDEAMAKTSKIKFYADGARIPGMDDKKLEEYSSLAEKYGFTAKVGGRFIGINKGCDKGKATQVLLELFEEEHKRILSIGLGDSPNDFLMLDKVDYAFLLAKPDGSHAKHQGLDIKNIDNHGPKGWSVAVSSVLDKLNHREN